MFVYYERQISSFCLIIQQLQQLSELKSKSDVSAEEILHKQIKLHEEALDRSKQSLAKLKK